MLMMMPVAKTTQRGCEEMKGPSSSCDARAMFRESQNGQEGGGRGRRGRRLTKRRVKVDE